MSFPRTSPELQINGSFFRALVKATSISCLVALIISCGSLLAVPDDVISLKIVDAHTGKPIQNVSASIIKWNKDQVQFLSTGKSNHEGLIVFRLSDPLPDRIGIDLSPVDLGNCSDLAFPTKEILQDGLLSENKCGAQSPQASLVRKPGELIIFATKISFWEKLRKELP